MNRDDILKAAVDAGFIGMNAGSEVVLGIPMSTGDTLVSLLERFAQAIEAQVREECAKEADYYANNSITAKNIASSIRKAYDGGYRCKH